MITKEARFARFSKNFCWVVAAIWLVLSILNFTGDSESAMINGFLWLAGAVAFAISALFIGKNSNSSQSQSEQISD